MSKHSAMFNAAALPLTRSQFGETVWQWPLGVEANEVEHRDVIVQWKGAGWTDKYGILAEKAEAIIKLPVAVSVNGGGKDTFVLTDPQNETQVQMVTESMVAKDNSIQAWALTRMDVQEIARPGYRRSR